MLLSEIVPHDGRCLVTNLFELRNHRIHLALVTFPSLFENGGNVKVLGILGTIPREKKSVNLIKMDGSRLLAWDGPFLAIFGVEPCCQQTPERQLEQQGVTLYIRELSDHAFWSPCHTQGRY